MLQSPERGFRFLAGYSFLYCHTGLVGLKKEVVGASTMRFNSLAPNFGYGVGGCTGIVGLFKHLLRVTTPPPIFLVLELQVPVGVSWDTTVYIPVTRVCTS